jgi:hypothetical protein
MIIGHQLLPGAFKDVSAVLQNIGTIAHGQRLGDVLLNQKNSDPFLVDLFY